MQIKNKYDYFSLTVILLLTAFRLFLIGTEQAFYFPYFLVNLLALFSLWSIKHNFIHAPFFTSKSINEVLSKLLTINTGTSAYNTILVHIINHHHHRNDEEDWTEVSAKNNKGSDFWQLLRYPFITIPQLIKGKRAYFKKHPNSPLRSKIKWDNRLILVMYLLCFVLATTATFWYLLLPMVLGQWFLLATNYLQHRGCDHTSEMDHSINYTGWFYNLLFFNSGYHTVHHNFPNAHWSVLRKLHEKEILPYINPTLNKRNFLQSLFFDK